MKKRKKNEGKMCSVRKCKGRAVIRGYCQKHDRRIRDYGSTKLPTKKCKVRKCNKVVTKGGLDLDLCREHKWTMKHYGTTKPKCKENNCNREVASLGYCTMHYARLRRREDASITLKPGSKSSGYNNGYGYLVCRVNYKRVLVHRLYAEQLLNRPLRKDENIHHRNGDRANNTISISCFLSNECGCKDGPHNLELWSTRQPQGQRVNDKIQYAIEILKRYSPDKLK